VKNYADLIDQSFEFPSSEFEVKDKILYFHGVNLMGIVEKYGTPLKLSYIPKIGQNIRYAQEIFNGAMAKHNYAGNYTYCYCTKSSHFQFILEEVLSNGAHIETSSAFDIPIIHHLLNKKLINKQLLIICNGFKRPKYIENIIGLIYAGFTQCIPILDNFNELEQYTAKIDKKFKIGIRVASDEEPNFSFYTSRLGFRYRDIIDYYKERIQGNAKVEFKLLHFFINTGIKDSAYYWSELSRFIHMYCELKKICPSLDTIDIGGGFPIKNKLNFEFDYSYMADQIIENITWICAKNHTPTPHIITEFGNYTVGESGATIYSVLDQKLQNDKELWYMMDGSFITHMPDVWGVNQKYILLPLNLWNNVYHRVNIGGLTCDSMDYYDSEAHIAEVFLPKYNKAETLYFGFFNTGAYQEALGGYGGIQHCLIPAPKHVIINKDPEGSIISKLFAEEQKNEDMLKILGYT